MCSPSAACRAVLPLLLFALVSSTGCSGGDAGAVPRTPDRAVTSGESPEAPETVSADQVGPVSLLAEPGSRWSPVRAPDGSVVYADSEDLSLKRLFPDGEVRELLPAGSAAGFLHMSPGGRYVGFAAPIELPPGSTQVGLYGAAIMDLESGEVVAARTREGAFTHPHGWYRDGWGHDKLVVSEWDARQAGDAMDLHALAPDGGFAQVARGLPLAHTPPQFSPDDHKWMYYEDGVGNTVLVYVESGWFHTIPGLRSPAWTKAGLTGEVDGQQVRVPLSALMGDRTHEED